MALARSPHVLAASTWGVYRRHFGRLVGLAALVQAPLALVDFGRQLAAGNAVAAGVADLLNTIG